MTGRRKGILMLVFQIIALVLFFNAPGSIQDGYFCLMLVGGGSLLGAIVGAMLDDDI